MNSKFRKIIYIIDCEHAVFKCSAVRSLLRHHKYCTNTVNNTMYTVFVNIDIIK